MNRLLMFLCSVALMANCAQAGLFKTSVDLADLAEVSPESLKTLQGTEFAVFVAEVRLSTAKAAAQRASGAIKGADRTLEAEELDLKAARAELKAAEANRDVERTTAATARLAGAREDLATADALRKWKSQEREARQAEVGMAKSAIDLAEAQRDLARARLLSRENAPSSEKYDLGDLERAVAKRQKEYDSASRKTTDKNARTDKLRVAWERLAGHDELSETE